MKTEIWVSFNYGGWSLVFKKEIELRDDKYCTTTIDYDLNKKEFNIDVRNRWPYPISNEVVDETLEIFSKTGWERMDNKTF